MRKAAACLLVLSLAFVWPACKSNADAYTVTIDDAYALAEALEPRYSPGEEVTIRLHAVTEQYYRVFVDDDELPFCSSDMAYICFTFTMPAKDVQVRVETVSVAPPDA